MLTSKLWRAYSRDHPGYRMPARFSKKTCREAHATHRQTDAQLAPCSAESTYGEARGRGEGAAEELPAARAAAHQAQLNAETLRTAAVPLRAQVSALHMTFLLENFPVVITVE